MTTPLTPVAMSEDEDVMWLHAEAADRRAYGSEQKSRRLLVGEDRRLHQQHVDHQFAYADRLEQIANELAERSSALDAVRRERVGHNVPEVTAFKLGESWSTDMLIDWLTETAERSTEVNAWNLRVCAERLAALYYGDLRPPDVSTDEMIEVAADALAQVTHEDRLKNLHPGHQDDLRSEARTVLNALADLRSARPATGGG
jgi:hypothetical protein